MTCLYQNNDHEITMTYGFFQNLGIRMVFGSVPQDLFQEQWVFDQSTSRNVQEAPKV